MMDIDKPLLKSLLIMADVIEARDPYTGGHVWRVSQFAKLLATKIGLPEDEIIKVSLAAYLHDMGKVSIPDDILKKAEKLSEAEFTIIQTHPQIGGRLLSGHSLGELVRAAAEEHHERIDGNGYPKGLRGDEISLVSRLVSVADAFDAMTSTRPYRKGMSVETALARLKAGAGTQFDARLVDEMCSLGQAGDLAHIVGHTAEGIPAIPCPHCGAVLNVPQTPRSGDVVYCRACHGELMLNCASQPCRAEMTGMTDDPRKLLPIANEIGADNVLA
ncbi:MAG: hypothetical protein OHK0031_12760 [Anaerolineales bacterium]